MISRLQKSVLYPSIVVVKGFQSWFKAIGRAVWTEGRTALVKAVSQPIGFGWFKRLPSAPFLPVCAATMNGVDFFVRPKRKLNEAVLFPDPEGAFVARLATMCTNHFQYLGDYDPRLGCVVLTREEVVWLLEKRALALRLHDDQVSIQFAVATLLSCSKHLADYLVYVKLRSNGYIVWKPCYSYLSSIPNVSSCDFVLFEPNAKFSKRNVANLPFWLCFIAQEHNTLSQFGRKFIEMKNQRVLVAIVAGGNVSFLRVGEPLKPSEVAETLCDKSC